MRKRRSAYRSWRPVLPSGLAEGAKFLFWGVVFLLTLTVFSLSIRVLMEWEHRSWFGREPLRILVMKKQGQNQELASLSVVSVWPDTKKVVALEFDPDINVTAVGGYGEYRLGALLMLGEVEGVGETLLADSLTLLLGVPIHAVYETNNSGSFLTGTRNQILKQALQGKVSMAEALDVWNLVSQVRKRQVETIAVGQRNVIRSQEEVDGSTGRYFEPVLIDSLVANRLSARWAEAASIQVAVINATGKSHMAGSWSRMPRLSGMDVVSVTDQAERAEKTTIMFDESLPESVELLILKSLFPLAEQVTADVSAYRSDVAVIIGDDLWRFMYDREAYLATRKR
jgi:hypothetical protein